MLAHRRRLRRVVSDIPFAAGNKGPTMRPFRSTTTRSQIAKALKSAAVALLCVIALYQPRFAYAAHDGGGGFHGRGFHAGGFHIGALHAGGFHAGRFYGGFAGLHNGLNRVNEGHWYHGWHGGRYGWRLIGPGLTWTYYSYPWWGYYSDYGYYDYAQPSTWYCCADPAGYYPYVIQCNSGWVPVPAS
jgi:hypothetical protein